MLILPQLKKKCWSELHTMRLWESIATDSRMSVNNIYPLIMVAGPERCILRIQSHHLIWPEVHKLVNMSLNVEKVYFWDTANSYIFFLAYPNMYVDVFLKKTETLCFDWCLFTFRRQKIIVLEEALDRIDHFHISADFYWLSFGQERSANTGNSDNGSHILSK